MNQSKVVIAFFCLTVLSTPSSAEREISPLAAVFSEAKESVFRVFSDGGTGTGFLVDARGLILTNSHVVAYTKEVTVQITEDLRVPARIIENEPRRDISVLAVNPRAVAGLTPLRLAQRPASKLAFEGERVLAIGNPLHQSRIVTSGIVSKVEERALITDVNINPGNSGGPLLNFDGEVIGVVTFRDVGGQAVGVGGCVSVSEAWPILNRARQSSFSPPELRRLPLSLRLAFPIEGLEWIIKQPGDDRDYRVRAIRDVRTRNWPPSSIRWAHGLTIELVTPVRSYRKSARASEAALKNRRRHERDEGVLQQDRYDPLAGSKHTWTEYVGERESVVTIVVSPKIGPTGSSLFATVMVGTPTTEAKYEADVDDAVLLADGRPIYEAQRTVSMVPALSNIAGVPLRDRAKYAVLVFRPEVFYASGEIRKNLVLKIAEASPSLPCSGCVGPRARLSKAGSL